MIIKTSSYEQICSDFDSYDHDPHWVELAAVLADRPGWICLLERGGPFWAFGWFGQQSLLGVSVSETGRYRCYVHATDDDELLATTEDVLAWAERHETAATENGIAALRTRAASNDWATLAGVPIDIDIALTGEATLSATFRSPREAVTGSDLGDVIARTRATIHAALDVPDDRRDCLRTRVHLSPEAAALAFRTPSPTPE